MNLRKIKRIKRVLTLSIILATGLRKYFKYKENKKQEEGKKDDK